MRGIEGGKKRERRRERGEEKRSNKIFTHCIVYRLSATSNARRGDISVIAEEIKDLQFQVKYVIILLLEVSCSVL